MILIRWSYSFSMLLQIMLQYKQSLPSMSKSRISRLTKIAWSAEEDRILKEIVAQKYSTQSKKSWKLITRDYLAVCKQKGLNPFVAPNNADKDGLIYFAHFLKTTKGGPTKRAVSFKWKTIAREMKQKGYPFRGQNTVKNKFNAMVKKCAMKINHQVDLKNSHIRKKWRIEKRAHDILTLAEPPQMTVAQMFEQLKRKKQLRTKSMQKKKNNQGCKQKLKESTKIDSIIVNENSEQKNQQVMVNQDDNNNNQQNIFHSIIPDIQQPKRTKRRTRAQCRPPSDESWELSDSKRQIRQYRREMRDDRNKHKADDLFDYAHQDSFYLQSNKSSELIGPNFQQRSQDDASARNSFDGTINNKFKNAKKVLRFQKRVDKSFIMKLLSLSCDRRHKDENSESFNKQLLNYISELLHSLLLSQSGIDFEEIIEALKISALELYGKKRKKDSKRQEDKEFIVKQKKLKSKIPPNIPVRRSMCSVSSSRRQKQRPIIKKDKMPSLQKILSIPKGSYSKGPHVLFKSQGYQEDPKHTKPIIISTPPFYDVSPQNPATIKIQENERRPTRRSPNISQASSKFSKGFMNYQLHQQQNIDKMEMERDREAFERGRRFGNMEALRNAQIPYRDRYFEMVQKSYRGDMYSTQKLMQFSQEMSKNQLFCFPENKAIKQSGCIDFSNGKDQQINNNWNQFLRNIDYVPEKKVDTSQQAKNLNSNNLQGSQQKQSIFNNQQMRQIASNSQQNNDYSLFLNNIDYVPKKNAQLFINSNELPEVNKNNISKFSQHMNSNEILQEKYPNILFYSNLLNPLQMGFRHDHYKHRSASGGCFDQFSSQSDYPPSMNRNVQLSVNNQMLMSKNEQYFSNVQGMYRSMPYYHYDTSKNDEKLSKSMKYHDATQQRN